MVSLVAPIPWVEVDGINTADGINKAEAVQLWLNEYGGDLSSLTLEDLRSLIQHLKTEYPDSAGIQNFVKTLETLARNWSAYTPGRNKVENEMKTLDFQVQFLNALKGTAPGTDALDTAVVQLTNKRTELDNLLRFMNSPPIDWSEDPNGTTSVEFVNEMLAKLNAFTSEQSAALGLDGFHADLTAALAAYKSNVQAAGADTNNRNIAASQFRTAVGEAMVKQYSASGAGESVVANQWRTELKQEANYYDFLTVPMDEEWIPPPTGYSNESLNAAWEEADRMYKAAVAKGDTVAAEYFSGRKKIISKAITNIGEAKTPYDKFVASLHLYQGLLQLNKTRLSVMLESVADTDKPLADRIGQRVVTIDDLMNEVKKGGTDLLERLATVYQASRV